jgi:coenzyme F420-reducing hydrogenase delta subunit
VTYPVSCTGNVHSSVVEFALRGGAEGVILYSCPRRDCRGREGPIRLEQRLFHDREAELQPRVDKRRVAIATMAVGDLTGTLDALTDFRRRLAQLVQPPIEPGQPEEAVCEPPVTALDAT